MVTQGCTRVVKNYVPVTSDIAGYFEVFDELKMAAYNND